MNRLTIVEGGRGESTPSQRINPELTLVTEEAITFSCNTRATAQEVLNWLRGWGIPATEDEKRVFVPMVSLNLPVTDISPLPANDGTYG